MRSLDNCLEPKAGHVGEVQHRKVALLGFIPVPIPAVGIPKRMVDAGAKGETLCPQVRERLGSILLCSRQIVLNAGDEASNSRCQSQLPARLFVLRRPQPLFSFINAAET